MGQIKIFLSLHSIYEFTVSVLKIIVSLFSVAGMTVFDINLLEPVYCKKCQKKSKPRNWFGE